MVKLRIFGFAITLSTNRQERLLQLMKNRSKIILIVVLLSIIPLLVIFLVKSHKKSSFLSKKPVFLLNGYENLKCNEAKEHSSRKWQCDYYIPYIPSNKKTEEIARHFTSKGYERIATTDYHNKDYNNAFRNEFEKWKKQGADFATLKLTKSLYKKGGFNEPLNNYNVLTYSMGFNNESMSVSEFVNIFCLRHKFSHKNEGICFVSQNESIYYPPYTLYVVIKAQGN